MGRLAVDRGHNCTHTPAKLIRGWVPGGRAKQDGMPFDRSMASGSAPVFRILPHYTRRRSCWSTALSLGSGNLPLNAASTMLSVLSGKSLQSIQPK
jgi:hypothetical protein